MWTVLKISSGRKLVSLLSLMAREMHGVVCATVAECNDLSGSVQIELDDGSVYSVVVTKVRDAGLPVIGGHAEVSGVA